MTKTINKNNNRNQLNYVLNEISMYVSTKKIRTLLFILSPSALIYFHYVIVIFVLYLGFRSIYTQESKAKQKRQRKLIQRMNLIVKHKFAYGKMHNIPFIMNIIRSINFYFFSTCLFGVLNQMYCRIHSKESILKLKQIESMSVKKGRVIFNKFFSIKKLQFYFQ